MSTYANEESTANFDLWYRIKGTLGSTDRTPNSMDIASRSATLLLSSPWPGPTLDKTMQDIKRVKAGGSVDLNL
jgi:hypothetical protein